MNAQNAPAEALRSRIECLVCQMMEILGVSNYKELSRAIKTYRFRWGALLWQAFQELFYRTALGLASQGLCVCVFGKLQSLGA